MVIKVCFLCLGIKTEDSCDPAHVVVLIRNHISSLTVYLKDIDSTSKVILLEPVEKFTMQVG